MNKIWCCAILFLLPAFSSCFLGKKSHHQALTGADSTITGDTTKRFSDNVQRTADSIFATVKPKENAIPSPVKESASGQALISQALPLWKKRLVYSTFTGKARVKFEGPDNKQEFTANIHMRKDSLIWINIVAIGLPVARILVTPDSFYLINYLQEEITFRPLSDASKVLPAKMDFSSLQNLLTGEPLREGDITSADSSGGSWALRVEDTSYIQHIIYNKTDSTIQTTQLLTRKPNGPEANEVFSNYEQSNKGKVSTDRELTIKNGSDTYLLKLNMLKSEFDQPVDFPFPVPKNYSVK